MLDGSQSTITSSGGFDTFFRQIHIHTYINLNLLKGKVEKFTLVTLKPDKLEIRSSIVWEHKCLGWSCRGKQTAGAS